MNRFIKLFAILLVLASAFMSSCGNGGNDMQTNAQTAQKQQSVRLSNPDASEEAVRLYEYICGSFGSYMLSCQQESTWMSSPEYEMEHIYKVTGKYPAMRGLDFMNNDLFGSLSFLESFINMPITFLF